MEEKKKPTWNLTKIDMLRHDPLVGVRYWLVLLYYLLAIIFFLYGNNWYISSNWASAHIAYVHICSARCVREFAGNNCASFILEHQINNNLVINNRKEA